MESWEPICKQGFVWHHQLLHTFIPTYLATYLPTYLAVYLLYCTVLGPCIPHAYPAIEDDMKNNKNNSNMENPIPCRASPRRAWNPQQPLEKRGARSSGRQKNQNK